MNEDQPVEAVEDTSVESPVLVLPGHVFFVDRIELPAGLESTDISDFAELCLEDLAPFPVEQLYWGFLHHEPDGAILLYATYKERIAELGHKDVHHFQWVLPDFATTFGAYFPEAKTLLLESADGGSLISLEPGAVLLSHVKSYAPDSKAPPSAESSRPLVIHIDSIALNDQGLPTFHFKARERIDESTTGHWKQVSPSESQLWQADIRDREFKKTERNNRKLSAWLGRATAYAGVFIILLLVLEGLLYAGAFWLQAENQKIARQAPDVRRVEDKQSLMNKLDQVAQNELRPIAILDALNQSRPEGIYFTKTVAEDQNRITIDGIARTISELNAYLEALEATGSFQLKDSDRITRGGKTTFSATLDYTHSTTGDRPGRPEPEPGEVSG